MSNLPPGVSVGMIPGNRPEDVQYEEFWNRLDAKLKERLSVDQWAIYESLMRSNSEDVIVLIADTAAELGESKGYYNGTMDQQLAQAHDEEH